MDDPTPSTSDSEVSIAPASEEQQDDDEAVQDGTRSVNLLQNDPAFVEPITRAWRRHVQKLEGWERERFEAAAGEGDLNAYVLLIKGTADAQKKKSWSQHVTDWVEPIFNTTRLYIPAAATAIQAYPNPGSLVLGGIVCVLQISENYRGFQEKLGEALQETAVRLKVLDGYSGIYRTDQDVQEALCDVYGAMLDFCSELFRLLHFKRKSRLRRLKMFGNSLITTFDQKYNSYIRDFRRSLEVFEETAKRSERRRAEEERQKADEARMAAANFVSDQQQANFMSHQLDSEIRSEIMGISEFSKTAYERDREEAKRKDEAKLREKIINWIDVLSFESDYSSRDLTRLNGTCEWIVAREEYKEWKSSPKSCLLWIKGKHGCGKSILASRVIKDIEDLRTQQDRHGVGLAFVFCKKQQGSKDDPLTLMRSLLGQLVIRQESLDPVLRTSFNDNNYLQSKGPLWQQATKCLRSVIKGFKEAFIIFDGLDECKDSYAISKELLELSKLSDIPVKLLLLSRPNYATIEQFFGDCRLVVMDEGANDNDLKSFIEEKCSQQLIGLKNSNDIELAQRAMFSKAERTFLYVDLKAGDLKRVSSPGQLKRVLNALPRGIHEIYREALTTVAAEPDEENRRYALSTLLWTMYAKRPLAKAEMFEAISVVADTHETPDDDLIQNDAPWAHLLSDLIRVDEKGYYQLVHSSVKDYCEAVPYIGTSLPEPIVFEKTRSDSIIAQICLTYLLFDRFDKLELKGVEELFEKSPFLSYCTSFWSHHLCGESETAFQDKISSLVDESSRRDMLVQCHAGKMFPEKRPARKLHLVALYNLVTTAKHLKLGRSNKGLLDGFGYSPLHYAFREKNEQVCLWMLDNDDSAVPQELDRHVRSSLNAAVVCGWPAVIERLLALGVDVNQPNLWRETPIISAALRANKTTAEWGEDGAPRSIATYPTDVFTETHRITQLLLRHGADADARHYNDTTPIALAAFAGDEILFQILAETHVDMSIRKSDASDQTLLHLAVRAKSIGMTKFVAQFVDIDVRDYNQNTPLHIASKVGLVEIIKYLVEQGADQSCKNDDDFTALFCAVQGKSLEAVQYMLETSQQSIDTELAGHLTGVSLAAREGCYDIMKLFLERGASPRTSSPTRNLLFAAVRGGDKQCVKLALQQGLDISTTDRFGNSPLNLAAGLGHHEIISLLLQSGADIKFQNDRKETALHLAAWSGSTLALKLLLDTPGIDISVVDQYGRTPLLRAARGGGSECFGLLVDKGADIEQTADSEFPIHQAAFYGNLELVKYLKNQVRYRGFAGTTPLHVACLDGHLDIVHYLISEGVDLDALDVQGHTPLFLALLVGHSDVAKALIELGCDVRSRNFQGRTPLLQAVISDDLELVTMIMDRGGDPLAEDDYNQSPLQISEKLLSDRILRHFMSRGFQCDFKVTSHGTTSLHNACISGNLELVDRFLKEGADPQTQDRNNFSSLTYAAYQGHTYVFNRLLEAGASPDEFTLPAMTELGQYDCVVKALLAGAEVDIASKVDFQTPLMIAAISGNIELLELYIKLGADLLLRDAYGFCAYDYALAHPKTKSLVKQYDVSYRQLSDTAQSEILKQAISRSIACIIELTPHDSPPSLTDRSDYIDLLAVALRFVGSTESLDQYAVIQQDLLYQRDLSQEYICPCIICNEDCRHLEAWICKQEFDVILCDECYERHMRPNRIENAAPYALTILEGLEAETRQIALACWPLVKFGIAKIVVCFFMAPSLTSWFYKQVDRYQQWEVSFEAEKEYESIKRPGQELLQILQEAMSLFEDLSPGELSMDRDPRYAALDTRLEKLSRTYKPIRAPQAFSCAGHDFIHIEKIELDDPEYGKFFSGNWVIKPEYLERILKSLEKPEFFEKQKTESPAKTTHFVGDETEGTEEELIRKKPLPPALQGEERRRYLSELDEKERTAHFWDRSSRSIQKKVMPQECLIEETSEYLDAFLSEAVYKLCQIIEPESAESVFAEIYGCEEADAGEDAQEDAGIVENGGVSEEPVASLSHKSNKEGISSTTRQPIVEINATIERARHFAQSRKFQRKRIVE